MNRKGQALIEFVLIMPVLLFILLAVFDFGMILSNKTNLSSISEDIVNMYQNGEPIETINNEYKDVKINIENYKSKYKKITIEKDLKVFTPGLSNILGNPYQIKIERVISNAK
ncbi:MAG: pilus assembly protein [Bacilli bacterium]|nr:pilus assembly protein [Bacilli bacterium]